MLGIIRQRFSNGASRIRPAFYALSRSYSAAVKEISKGLLEKYGPERVCDTPITEAIDHIINSAAKSTYMSTGQLSVPIVFRGPNGAAAGVGAQHS
ncbi:hypothetical protein REPUB_Repub08aG0029900 [Reevesia pubescens]